MNCRTPGSPVHHQLPEFTQTHVHWVGDVIQPSHPLPPTSPSAFNLSQHQGLFQWLGASHQVAKVLELPFQHQSLQWMPRGNFLYDWLVWSPCIPRGSQESSAAPQFEASVLQSSNFYTVQLSHSYMTTRKTIALTIQTFVVKVTSLLFNMLSSFVTVSFQGASVFLISWLKLMGKLSTIGKVSTQT